MSCIALSCSFLRGVMLESGVELSCPSKCPEQVCFLSVCITRKPWRYLDSHRTLTLTWVAPASLTLSDLRRVNPG